MIRPAPAQTFVMVPIDEYERLKERAEKADFWQGQADSARHDKDEAQRLAVAAVLGAGGEVRISRMDLYSIEHDPDKWELAWNSSDGISDPLGENLRFVIRPRPEKKP